MGLQNKNLAGLKRLGSWSTLESALLHRTIPISRALPHDSCASPENQMSRPNTPNTNFKWCICQGCCWLQFPVIELTGRAGQGRTGRTLAEKDSARPKCELE